MGLPLGRTDRSTDLEEAVMGASCFGSFAFLSPPDVASVAMAPVSWSYTNEPCRS